MPVTMSLHDVPDAVRVEDPRACLEVGLTATQLEQPVADIGSRRRDCGCGSAVPSDLIRA